MWWAALTLLCVVGMLQSSIPSLLADVNAHPSVESQQESPLEDPVAQTTFTLFLPYVTTSKVRLEDATDIVTVVDSGFNDFSGNMGVVNASYGQMELPCRDESPCPIRFKWNFGPVPEAFTGVFLSLFGLTETITTFDGSNTEIVDFPEHYLDLNDIDSPLREPGGPRRLEGICFNMSYQAAEALKLRVELKDTQGGTRFTRLTVPSSPSPQVHCWYFRDPDSYHSGDNLNIRRAKELILIVERQHVADNVQNPGSGLLDIHDIWFTPGFGEFHLENEQELLDLLERRAYQYFLDWSSRKDDSMDIPQDRSTFGDLLTVGGIGFVLPAHIIAAERGWIGRDEAAERVLNVLDVLHTSGTFGPERVGRVGYRGWFYHFLGIDGRRKHNFDRPTTPDRDESLDTVELSTIDTGLALMGVLAAQSYFDAENETEGKIRDQAQKIYNRVEWPFMLEENTRQFYLGWKPHEIRDDEEHPFDIPDSEGLGHYSGTLTNAHTLDYYTDEALILILLAAGATEHPLEDPLEVYCALEMEPDDEGLVRTWPGSLFTYQFLRAFIDTREFQVTCPGQEPIDWYANSRQAIFSVIDYAEENPRGFETYGPDAWGISAAEGPWDVYHAYGAPSVAVNPEPEEDGTITYYAMMSAVSFGEDLRQRSISALHAAWKRGHWHPRFAIPDAFNDEISQAEPIPTPDKIVRDSGPWVQWALFAIDQGPMLLHLENARSGLIWDLLAENPNIQRALERLGAAASDQIILEGEAGTGDGIIRPRLHASGQETVWLHEGESRTLPFSLNPSAPYTVSVRYSNDNFGPLETVEVSFNGESLGQFTAEDTGDWGDGWDVFRSSGPIGVVEVIPGSHEIVISVSGGDGEGVEIDTVYLDRH
jgi:hypothetical protein